MHQVGDIGLIEKVHVLCTSGFRRSGANSGPLASSTEAGAGEPYNSSAGELSWKSICPISNDEVSDHSFTGVDTFWTAQRDVLSQA